MAIRKFLGLVSMVALLVPGLAACTRQPPSEPMPRAATAVPTAPAASAAATRPRRPSNIPAGVQLLSDLPFATVPHAAKPDDLGSNVKDDELLLDLYLPEKRQGRLPLVIWIHGGSWVEGSKKYCQGAWLATRGYAVASINYRLSLQAPFPAQIYDCKAAVRWLRAHADDYQLDAGHFGVYGESAGGYLAALLGTTENDKTLEGELGAHRNVSSSVQAVCERYGTTDFTRAEDAMAATTDPKIRFFQVLVLQKLLGVAVNDPGFAERARLASPLTYVGKNAAPFLILHGAKDALVPLQQSELLDAALRKSGVPSTLQVIPGAGHGFVPNAEQNRGIQEFFDRYLKAR